MKDEGETQKHHGFWKSRKKKKKKMEKRSWGVAVFRTGETPWLNRMM